MSALPSLIAALETSATPLSFEPVLLALLTIAVLYALVSLAGLRREVARLTSAPSPTAATPTVTPRRADIPTEEIPPELVAIIAAAVHVTLGSTPHRIVAMSPAEPSSAWSAEGRREVFLSHRVR